MSPFSDSVLIAAFGSLANAENSEICGMFCDWQIQIQELKFKCTILKFKCTIQMY